MNIRCDLAEQDLSRFLLVRERRMLTSVRRPYRDEQDEQEQNVQAVQSYEVTSSRDKEEVRKFATRTTWSFIHQRLYSPLLGPGLFFSFVIYTDGRTPWTSDQPVARPLPSHRTTQIQNKCAHRHPCLEWDSNPRSQRSSERRQFVWPPWLAIWYLPGRDVLVMR
jgi:hypothetical protein